MSKAKITNEDVVYIANLSKLNLDAKEIKNFASLLTDTISYFDVLDELDTSSVLGTYQVTGLTNVFMDTSLPATTLTKEDTLSNAGETINNKFVTKAVFDR